MNRIKLGLVRCSDIHGYYYGVMLADFDPMLLLEKYYIVHYYASNIYDPRKITIPKVDGFDHFKLATPFLKKGIPTFVDKPFSSNLKDAQEIVRLAEKHKAIIFAGNWYGIFWMAEIMILSGVRVKDLPKAISNREEIFKKYGLNTL